MQIKKVIAPLFASITLLVANADVYANQPTPEERAYKFRASLFQTFAWKLGRLAVSKGQNNSEAFNQHATDLVYLSGLIEEGFEIENSTPDGSKAKPEIWTDYEGFKEKATNMTNLTKALMEEGGMDGFDPRKFGSQACGSCHRNFKVKD